MLLTKSLLSLLPLLAATLATPIANGLESRQTTDDASATIISYFVATACDSPFSQATQTLSANVCMDLGEDDTTRSIAIYAVSGVCSVQVWEDEKCSSDDSEVVAMQIGSSVANKTCIDQPSWPDLSKMLGSVKLICNS